MDQAAGHPRPVDCRELSGVGNQASRDVVLGAANGVRLAPVGDGGYKLCHGATLAHSKRWKVPAQHVGGCSHPQQHVEGSFLVSCTQFATDLRVCSIGACNLNVVGLCKRRRLPPPYCPINVPARLCLQPRGLGVAIWMACSDGTLCAIAQVHLCEGAAPLVADVNRPDVQALSGGAWRAFR